jgi:hypothetical protein
MRPAGGPPPPNGLTGVWGVARPQGGRSAAVLFPLGYPFPYGPARNPLWAEMCRKWDKTWMAFQSFSNTPVLYALWDPQAAGGQPWHGLSAGLGMANHIASL